jgi:hypothetical protein
MLLDGAELRAERRLLKQRSRRRKDVVYAAHDKITDELSLERYVDGSGQRDVNEHAVALFAKRCVLEGTVVYVIAKKPPGITAHFDQAVPLFMQSRSNRREGQLCCERRVESERRANAIALGLGATFVRTAESTVIDGLLLQMKALGSGSDAQMYNEYRRGVIGDACI